MNVIDRFLTEDMLITKPSVFIYINKNDKDNVINNGVLLQNGMVSSYLSRLPESSYKEFLDTHYPIRIVISKLKKIKDQIVRCVAKNIDGYDAIDINDDSVIDKLNKKYLKYLSVCYDDHIPIEKLPHIDLYFSSGKIPGFICKVLDT